MANISSSTYSSIADLTLFLKLQNNDELTLADLSTIIPLRWPYFRDNWEFVRTLVEERVLGYNEPNYLREQIDIFTDFIETQRTSTNKVNPFGSEDALFRYYAVFDNIPVNSIEISNQEQDIIDSETLRVSNFNRTDFVNIRDQLIAQRDIAADDIGLGDDDYNLAMKRSSVPAQLDPTITDMLRVQKIQEGVRSVDFVLANSFSLTTNFVDPFALARANANNPEIDIKSYQSGRLVRLNQGESLQLLARRYLGDADKWIDISIANGLKPPYIDEIGQKLSLISNGEGNQINLNENDLNGELNIDKLFINQVVLFQSDTQKIPESRKITNIRQVPVSGEIVLELDGLPNLDKYRIDENAHIRVFKANTINSSFFILIPSEEPLSNDRREQTPFFLQGKKEDERRQKVDLAIDDDGDLVFTSSGDVDFSFGVQNAIQAIKFKFQTKLGELRRHPEFGLVDITGQKSTDKEQMKGSLVESINEQIALDPRFDRVENLDVRYSVPSTNQGAAIYLIQLEVRLAGEGRVLPISFTVVA